MARMLYNGSSQIGLAELASINAALLTSTDQILINANCAYPATDHVVYEHINTSLNRYRDDGLVAFWDFPFSRTKSDIQLPEHDYLAWHTFIDNTLSNSTAFSMLQYLTDFNDSVKQEHSSMLIDVRKEYWYYAICNMLQSNQLLNTPIHSGPHPEQPLSLTSSYRYPTVEKPLAERLFRISNVSMEGLGLLPYKSFRRLRASSAPLRKLIQTHSSRFGDQDQPVSRSIDDGINEFTADLLQQYEKLHPKGVSRALTHILTLLGLVTLPAGLGLIVAAVAEADNVHSDLQNKPIFDSSIFYFMSKLSRQTQKAQQNQRRLETQ